MSGDVAEQKKEQELFKIYYEISKLLNTGLDAETLKYCMLLCESGVNPEKIAKMISEMKATVKNIEKKPESKETT